MNNEDHSNAAATILAQMGGTGRLSAMIGAKNFLSGHGDLGGVSFKFGRGKHVMITVNALDLYDFEFCRIVKYEKRGVKTIRNVGVENMREVFERETGLYLNL